MYVCIRVPRGGRFQRDVRVRPVTTRSINRFYCNLAQAITKDRQRKMNETLWPGKKQR